MDITKLGFIYTIEHVGVDGKIKSVERVKNLIPAAGIAYMLNAAYKGGSQYSSWYVGLFENDRTPLTTDTMTTLIADCGESVAYGSPATNRLLVNFAEVADGTLTSVADPNLFTFASAATIRGAFLASNITIGSTAGLLVSAVKFASPKVMAIGEVLKVPVGMALATA